MSKHASSDLSTLGLDELRELVVALLERVAALEAENAALRDENARLKGLNGRPKFKPSGMEAKAGASAATDKRRGKGKRCSNGSSKTNRRVLAVSEEQRLAVQVPPGSRFKGFEDFVAQDLRLQSRVIALPDSGLLYKP